MVLGADVENGVGLFGLHEVDMESEALGEYCECGRGNNGELFVSFCLEHRLKIYNTRFNNPLSSHTCHHYLKRQWEPITLHQTYQGQH